MTVGGTGFRFRAFLAGRWEWTGVAPCVSFECLRTNGGEALGGTGLKRLGGTEM